MCALAERNALYEAQARASYEEIQQLQAANARVQEQCRALEADAVNPCCPIVHSKL